MHKYKILAFLLVSAKLAIALPTIAIPSIIYPADIYQHNINNSDVRGAIINSGKFKVIETPKNFDLNTLELLTLNSSLTESQSTIKESAEIKSSLTPQAVVSLQDGLSYVLIGKVITIDENENTYQIKNTDTSSITHHIAVMTSYKLVRIKDQANVASFSAYGSASQMKLIAAGTNPDSLSFNRALLIHDLSKDLAKNVLNQLLEQVNTTNKIEQNEHPVVTEVKTYAE
jgi:hypothetical protein